MDANFLQKDEGILGHVTLKGRYGIYADVVFATSQEKAQKICGKWMDNEFALKYIELIHEESVDMTFWNRIK